MTDETPDRFDRWFWRLVRMTGWAGLVYDGLRPPADVSIPLALIFAALILGERGAQRIQRAWPGKAEG